MLEGGNERREREGVNLHAPGHEYIVHRCAMDVTKQGGGSMRAPGEQKCDDSMGIK